jgi:Rod binding domain-containing protein
MNVNFSLPAAIAAGPQKPASLPQPNATVEGETFHQALAQASAKPDKLADVAKQFEGLMIGQVLKAARESSDGGWLSSGDDQTGELTLELGEQAMSQAMASQGTFGIAKMVAKNLHQHDSKAASSGSVPSR